MKRDIAERFAATAIDDLALEDARKVIREFLRSLALCAFCGGSGQFTFGRDLEVGVEDPFRGRDKETRYIPAGLVTPCPSCRGTEENEAGGDPDYVAWHCVVGDSDRNCQTDRQHEKDRSDHHMDCAWRIVLPLVTAEGAT